MEFPDFRRRRRRRRSISPGSKGDWSTMYRYNIIWLGVLAVSADTSLFVNCIITSIIV